MKPWSYRTHQGRRFFRLNRAKNMKKDEFFLNYYRILHTAYLKRQRFCIAAVKRMFLDSFGLEPDAWSVSYILDTEKCFVNDAITEALAKKGSIECQDCLYRMLIEIGFDVYLIQTIEGEKKPEKNDFLEWLPLQKDKTLKEIVSCFWKERLPKEKQLFMLYYQLEPYREELIKTYRRILRSNESPQLQPQKKELILSELGEAETTFEETPETATEEVAAENEPDTITEEVTAENEPDTTFEETLEEATNTVTEEEPDTVTEEATKATTEEVTKATTEEVADTTAECVKVSNRVKKEQTKAFHKKTEEGCRGFHNGRRISKKKALTCAACVAIAGALLIPLVAYSVSKR